MNNPENGLPAQPSGLEDPDPSPGAASPGDGHSFLRGGEKDGVAMQGGYVLLHRKLMDCITFSRGTDHWALFVYLLMVANWKESFFLGHKVERGQAAVSPEGIAKALGVGWSRKKVRYHLTILERDGVIRANQRANRFTLITICNYEKYQFPSGSEGPTEGPTRGQPRANQGPHHKEGKEGNKEIQKEDIPVVCVEAEEIVAHLNALAGTSFRHTTQATARAISARLAEGNTVEDFKLVHEFKWAEWKNKPEMRPHFCPETLYRPSKFEKYLNAARGQDTKPKTFEETLPYL